jgi:hypothetical protein
MPYAYLVEAMVRFPRSIQKKRFVKTGMVEKILPEISGALAPVVAGLEFDGGRVVHEIRFFRGEFYAMACSTDHVYPRPRPCEAVSAKRLFSPGRKIRNGPLLPHLLLEEAKRSITPPEVRALASIASLGFHIPEYEDSRVMEITATSEDHDRDLARKAIDQIIVVDGEVWTRIEEPRFIISTPMSAPMGILGRQDGLGTFSAIGYGMPSESAVETSPDELRFYSLTSRDVVNAEIARHGEDLIRTLEPDALPDIRIYDPSVFTADWEGFQDRQVLGVVLRTHGEDIGEQSAEFLSAWIACREAAAEYDRTKDHSALADVMSEHLPTLVASYVGARTEEMHQAAEHARRFCDRYEEPQTVQRARRMTPMTPS